MNVNVLLVSNQVSGIDGTGGLGDVASALPKELVRRGDIDIRVLMPGYLKISSTGLDDRFDRTIVAGLAVPFGHQTIPVDICECRLPRTDPSEPDVRCYLVKADLFDTARDSPEQAVLLGRSTLEFLRKYAAFRVDVIHCNDWHTGLIPVYLKTIFASDPYLGRVATLYTTHNLGEGYQGAFPAPDFASNAYEVLSWTGLDAHNVFVQGTTRSLEHRNQINFAKGGLGFADLLNTVSLQYAREVLNFEFAGGLDGLARERPSDLCGIVDGIDTVAWNPWTDAHLPPECRYSADDAVDDILSKKLRIRGAIRDWVDTQGMQPFTSLTDESVLIALVGRIADQKFPILLPVMADICRIPNVQLMILGSAHPKDTIGRTFAAATRSIAESRAELLFYEGFNVPLSHLMYAAADLFLVPSTYEPCGLTQQIAMRYGTLPVVRLVGGLVDTVIDERVGNHATGFAFPCASTYPRTESQFKAEAQLLLETVERAVTTRTASRSRWSELVLNAIHRDASWGTAARQYVRLYNACLERILESYFVERRMSATQKQM